MKEVRIIILKGKYANKIGIMDCCGWVSFSDIPDKIHRVDIEEWKFLDFKT